MNKRYDLTIKAAYLGYVVQAVVNNYLPLLFVQLQSEFGIPLGKFCKIWSICCFLGQFFVIYV